MRRAGREFFSSFVSIRVEWSAEPCRSCLLAIVELGGYPNLVPLYRRFGFETELVGSQRKAQSFLKRRLPDVIVAEYNFQRVEATLQRVLLGPGKQCRAGGR